MKTAASPLSAVPEKQPPRPFLVTFLRYWLPVLLWMSVMFGMSTTAGSSRNTSRIIGPILRWFDPAISDETVGAIQLVVRKLAHFTEYGVLALLLWRARRQPFRGDGRPWQWRQAGTAFAIAAIFAASDEWHQSFVPSREACVRDALIDMGGAAAALCALWWLGRRLHKW